MKILHVVAGILLLGITNTLTMRSALNYAGMCLDERRPLSDDELCRIAFKNWNETESKILVDMGIRRIRRVQTLPYSSYEEYQRLYPDSCMVWWDNKQTNKYRKDHYTISRMMGFLHGKYVQTSMYYRYLDDKGKKIIKLKIREIRTDTCGEIQTTGVL